ncbi:hypothetical protein OCGS_2240 [Oceaniovalibus guishaninsula JLT2003]|uniref:ADP/GDP-polyphosphate phosphotransferase n=1 Tax=Oceaniovalibus guishaninsula JLT2003 TaxID=1231392 RepID=K2H7B2_9RHOB|nr:polyphosphate kinase 2 [Oceaniovalibus guishaninsula]EKE43508.1 hypothetical protein OCGS_2240 [Oceaniovalibus guishaninsula JLT2003]
MPLPFDGAITRFADQKAPHFVRDRLRQTSHSGIASASYPYDSRLKKTVYAVEMHALQLQLARLQADVRSTGKRVVVVFEGRDAAGKGGTIKRLRENLNPRVCRVVALGTPGERERGEWYFQRYIRHLPTQGEIVLYDRSWYNRGVVERVFGFSTDDDRARFFRQVPQFEAMLVDDGIRLIKLWLNVGRAEQCRRFLKRERDPLKQWKLSRIDVEGLALWDAYSAAIEETFARTHTQAAPWTVIRADDKRRARLEAIRAVLLPLDYAGKDLAAIGAPDPAIVGAPDILHRDTDV